MSTKILNSADLVLLLASSWPVITANLSRFANLLFTASDVPSGTIKSNFPNAPFANHATLPLAILSNGFTFTNALDSIKLLGEETFIFIESPILNSSGNKNSPDSSSCNPVPQTFILTPGIISVL